MSGPKVSAYQVERTRQAALKARRSAIGSARAAMERRDLFVVRLRAAESALGGGDLTVSTAAIDLDAATETIRRLAAGLAQEVDEAERQLEVVSAERRAISLISLLQADIAREPVVQVDSASLLEQAAAKERQATKTDPTERDRSVQSRAIAILEQSGSLPPSETATIDRLVLRFEAATVDERSRLVMEMEAQVDAARRRTKSRERQVQRSEELLVALLGFEDDPAAIESAKIARRAREGSVSLDLQTEKELEQVIAECHQRADQAYVRGALASSLVELGYDVGDEFETLSVGQHIELRPGDASRWCGYAVRARAAGDGEIRWHLVRQDDRGRDVEHEAQLEAEWCADLTEGHRLVAERDGITSNLREQHRPGELPVMAVKAVNVNASTRSRRRKRERDATRSRSTDR